MYVIGGSDLGGYKVNATVVFNVESGRWRFGTEFPLEISDSGIVQLGDTFLVVGGETGKANWVERLDRAKSEHYLDTIYEYDWRNQDWILRPERLSKGRAEAAVLQVDRDVVC